MTVEVDVTLGLANAYNVSQASNGQLLVAGPCVLRGWSVRENSGAGSVADQLTGENSVLAGLAVDIVLGSPELGLTGWDLTITPATAAVTGIVSVKGAGVPTLQYPISQVTTAPLYLSVRYGSQPIPQNEVSVPAMVNGGAPTLDVFGAVTTLAAAQALMELSSGQTVIAEATPFNGGADSHILGGNGVYCPQGIKVSAVAGSFTGCIFAIPL